MAEPLVPDALWALVAPRIARRGVESSERLGRHRWVVERTLAWFARFRRLAVRHERRLAVLLGLHPLAAGLICLSFARRWSRTHPCLARPPDGPDRPSRTARGRR